MCEESDGKIHSGCTAVTAFLRIEDADGKQSFLNDPLSIIESPALSSSAEGLDAESSQESHGPESGEEVPRRKSKKPKRSSRTSRFRKALKTLSGTSAATMPRTPSPGASSTKGLPIVVPPTTCRRVLYTANAGDARGVICRGGLGVRLTYDHKGSDKQEAKRITDAGGFVMSGRVNGVLAVTRSLGDSSMKEFVVGAPYTTETDLCEEDEFLILACDGVRPFYSLCYHFLQTFLCVLRD
jgi:protein phosphatase PTC1